MEISTDKLIQDQLESLPANLREAIAQVPWKNRVRDIAKREGLSDEQAGSLETETMLILYGFSQADTYVDSLVTQVGVGEEQAERIAKLAADEIFSDIEKQFQMIEATAPEETTEASPVHADKAKPAAAEDKGLLNISPEILAKQIKMPSEPVDRLPKVVPGQAAHDVSHVDAPITAPISAPQPIIAPQPVPPAPEAKTSPASDAPSVSTPAAAAPQSIVEEKLSQVTVAEAQTAAPVSYPKGQDPYREPLE